MAKGYKYSKMLTSKAMHYCPGCTHGIAHKLVAEVLEELNLSGKVVGVASVGCSVFSYDYFNCDMQQAAHGRAPAVATGIKRTLPDQIVFTYQGDGDLASIGLAEIVHAATRNENITVIFINNAIYGMTGGQMAPTTLEGQKSSTSVYGRDYKKNGNPIRISEMFATLTGPSFIARGSLSNLKNVLNAKKLIKTAFTRQVEGKGFSMVELLSTCPTNWGLSPNDSMKYLDEKMQPFYPLGVYLDTEVNK